MSESTIAPRHARTPARPGDLTDRLIAGDSWTDQTLAEAGIPVVDAPFVHWRVDVGRLV